MALRADTTQLVGGLLASKYAGFGVRGDAIPSTGTDGPSPLYPCATLPADNAVEFRGVITRWPTLGTLDINEDHSLVYTGGSDYYEFRLYLDGVASTVDIGHGPGIVRVTFSVGQTSQGRPRLGVAPSGEVYMLYLDAAGVPYKALRQNGAEVPVTPVEGTYLGRAETDSGVILIVI